MTAGQAVGVGALHVGGEIVHFIVEQHPGAGHGKGRAEWQVDRQGGGHRITGGVEHREMRGVIAFFPAASGRQVDAGSGLLRVDSECQALQVVGLKQLRRRIGHEIGIAQQATITIGAA